MSTRTTTTPLFKDTEQLVAKCMSLGLIMRRGPHDITHASVTLQPMPIPQTEFNVLCERQPLWNEAVDNTARNFVFLRDALRETAASDTGFTGRLVQILQEVYIESEVYQSIMLGVFRTDYMRSTAAAEWKNVEINTISCSFAGLSPLVTDFHRHIAAYQRALQGGNTNHNNNHTNNNNNNNINIPVHHGVLERSKSAKDVPEALAAAVHVWCTQQNFDALQTSFQSSTHAIVLKPPIVLVVVQENERNTGDQYALLFEILESHGIISLRRTLQELHTSMELYPTSNGLPLAVVDHQFPVAVAYFRSTYIPADFPTESAWTTRLALERSSAIKCPSVPYHLLTFKKLQQLLCDVDNVLIPIAFKGNVEKAQELQRHFMPQYTLNPAEVGEAAVEKIIHEALQQPKQFVLKPQLEGGGNLLAGEEMCAALKITKEEDPVRYNRVRREYILMAHIDYPVSSGAFLVREEFVQLEHNLCSELGIYGVILSDGNNSKNNNNNNNNNSVIVLRNSCAGYIVRSKPANVEDGGVMAGVAALDSLTLI